MLFRCNALNETREIDNPEDFVTEKDGVTRNTMGEIIAVTPGAKDPECKGFLVTWVREDELVSIQQPDIPDDDIDVDFDDCDLALDTDYDDIDLEASGDYQSIVIETKDRSRDCGRMFVNSLFATLGIGRKVAPYRMPPEGLEVEWCSFDGLPVHGPSLSPEFASQVW